ncbi:MAG: WbqC family protein [Bacteroidota bacterium]|jgi:hypothetical protein
MSKPAILSIAYLPPAIYFKRLFSYNSVLFDSSEHFVKQTYRNRCSIYGANGKLDLIVPLIHSAERTPISDKKISYQSDWQKLHWRTLQSAYRSSPYFEFFEDDFRILYEKRFEYLFELNLELIRLICKLLRFELKFDLTQQYQKDYSGLDDFRNAISPKSEEFRQSLFPEVEYYQVFSNKFGFIPNLSIVDLLFNEGLKSVDFLTQ